MVSEMEPPKPSEFLVFSPEQDRYVLPQILEYQLDDDLYGHIPLRNKYLSHLVPVRSYNISNILSQCKWKGGYDLLGNQPAVGIVLSTPTESNLTECKRAWENISSYVSDETVCIMVIMQYGLVESLELIDWGVSHNIEIITEALCNDEDTTLVQRLQMVLGCAAWPQTSASDSVDMLKDFRSYLDQKQSTSDSHCSPRKSKGNDDTGKDELDEDHGICNTNQDRKPIVLPATRLRRELDQSDMQRLMDELLLDEE